jgi:acyl-CoA thioesterase FadM
VREDEYTMIEDVVGPGDPSNHHHLIDYQTQELVSRLWTKYMAHMRAEEGPSEVMQAMRRAWYQLDNEAFAGDQLQRGIRMVGRTRRSCTMAVGLWHADTGKMVHQGEIVTVFIHPQHGSVAIPDAWWAAVERLEGKTFDVVERAAG